MKNIIINSKNLKEKESIFINKGYNFIFNEDEKKIDTYSDIYLLIMDLNMECISFIKFVQKIKDKNKNMKVIALIDELENIQIRFLYDNNIDYILLNTTNKNTLIDSIQKILNIEEKDNKEESEIDIDYKTVEVLSRLGMPANLKGYLYIKEAIKLCLIDKNYYQHISLYLYPKLSEMYKIRKSNVEKSIRCAIELCWVRGDVDVQDEIFGYTVDKDLGRPTNSEFIAQLYNYLITN